MQKLLTKKQRLEQQAKKMMICTATKKKEHCIVQCFHGIPHKKESGREACHLNSEYCDILSPRIVKVTCKPLNKKQQKQWIKEEMKK